MLPWVAALAHPPGERRNHLAEPRPSLRPSPQVGFLQFLIEDFDCQRAQLFELTGAGLAIGTATVSSASNFVSFDTTDPHRFGHFTGTGLWESIGAAAGRALGFDGLALFPSAEIFKFFTLPTGPPGFAGGASAGFITGPVLKKGPELSAGSGRPVPQCTDDESAGGDAAPPSTADDVATVFAPDGDGLLTAFEPA